jgi:hypothetical protein
MLRLMGQHRRLWITLVVAFAVISAGCGASSGGEDAAQAVIVSAESKSEAASTFDMTVMLAQDIPPPGKGPPGLKADLSGEFDLSSNSYRETLAVTGSVTVTVIQI